MLFQGQSESKKSAKKQHNVETKGTAMSFGFRKISHSLTSHKKNSNTKQNEKGSKGKSSTGDSATVITNPGIVKHNYALDDKNGNTGSIDSLTENEQTGRTTPRLLPPKKDASGVPYRPNRFGFRQSNIVRPASVGLTPKIAENDCNSNIQNNNTIPGIYYITFNHYISLYELLYYIIIDLFCH